MKSKSRPEIKLGALLYPTGYHVAAWRHPFVPSNSGTSFDEYEAWARTAERGYFDFLFLADSLAMQSADMVELCRFSTRYVAQLEPITLLSALASRTHRIGLVGSASTTYNHPYHISRMFASLDHLSGGRAAWNVVTSQNENEAGNFGLSEHPPHEERYARAEEFVRVVKGLWDSYADDAFLCDKESGLFFDPVKVRALGHVGPHFSVAGPLNIPRPPQGHPVVIQAGSSAAGIELGAEHAEVVFTAQQTLADAKSFYQRVKAALQKYSRRPDAALVMPGVSVIVGRSPGEAEEKREQLRSLIHPQVGLSLLSGLLGDVDLTRWPVDGPLPPIPETNAGKSRRDLLLDMAAREGLSIRELYIRVAESRGHLQVVGTATEVADVLEEWFLAPAADGFNVIFPYLPGALNDFVDLVVPELQRRGLFRRSYRGQTLREHLGLPRPARESGRCAPTRSFEPPLKASAP